METWITQQLVYEIGFIVLNNFEKYSAMRIMTNKTMTNNIAFHMFNTCFLPLMPLPDLTDSVSSQL